MIRLHVALPFLLLSCAAPESPAPRETIKIVSALPRTGGAKSQTDFIVNSIKMAFEEAGWRAGKYRLVFEDIDTSSATDPPGWRRVESTAHEIVEDPNVMVCIGTYNSGAAKTYIPILNRENLLMISPANTWPGLTKPGKGDPEEPEIHRPTGRINYVRVVPADDVQGPIAAEWAKKSGLKRVFVLHDRETYGKGVAGNFQKRAEETGLEVLGHEGVDYEAQDFKTLMTRIKSLEPDLLYYGGTTETKSGEIARAMRAAGLTCRFMVPDACFEDRFIANADAENLNDRCFLTFGSVTPGMLTVKAAAFASNYKKKHGVEPESYAVYAYEAARVALEAIRRAGKKDRDAIRTACLSIRNFDGVLGRWSFDENGDTTFRMMSIYAVRNGKFEFVELMK